MPDGTYTVERTDSEGNTHRETKQRFTSIPVHMFYHSGFVSIGTYKGVEGAQGFDVGCDGGPSLLLHGAVAGEDFAAGCGQVRAALCRAAAARFVQGCACAFV